MSDNQTTTTANTAAVELLEKLKTALKSDGDFPASAHVVTELKSLTSNPQTTASQITEIILREPSLGARVLHLVNSSFYRRAKPIMTVSQAVVQIGMRPLAELCSGLILLQKFVPDARRGGPFATCLQRTIVTSLLSSQIGAAQGKPGNTQEEQGYLVGSFSEMGILLLAYYFPKVYEAASRRTEQKGTPIEQSIFELTGLTPLHLSAEVLKALNMPEYYQQVLNAAMLILSKSPTPTGPGQFSESSIKVGKTVCAAQDLSRVIVTNGAPAELARVMHKITQDYGISTDVLAAGIKALPTLFKDHCDAIELTLPRLPTSIMNFGEMPVEAALAQAASEESPRLDRFLDDIKKAVENHEPTASIITLVMETLAWSMKFDRVLLLLLDKPHTKLQGRIALGDKINIDPRSVERVISSLGHYAPDAQAFKYSRPVFMGDPILPGGHPLIALPIGRGDKCVGVIYADRVDSDTDLIDATEQANITALAELLNKSVVSHAKN